MLRSVTYRTATLAVGENIAVSPHKLRGVFHPVGELGDTSGHGSVVLRRVTGMHRGLHALFT